MIDRRQKLQKKFSKCSVWEVETLFYLKVKLETYPESLLGANELKFWLWDTIWLALVATACEVIQEFSWEESKLVFQQIKFLHWSSQINHFFLWPHFMVTLGGGLKITTSGLLEWKFSFIPEILQLRQLHVIYCANKNGASHHKNVIASKGQNNTISSCQKIL